MVVVQILFKYLEDGTIMDLDIIDQIVKLWVDNAGTENTLEWNWPTIRDRVRSYRASYGTPCEECGGSWYILATDNDGTRGKITCNMCG